MLLLAIHSALAADYNCDGYDDLVVGVPYEDGYGYTHVIYGSSGGLTTSGNQLWYQGTAGVEGTPGTDRFGFALGAGDFDGDACDDVAVGAPGETVGSASGAGAANVLYGTAAGVSATGDQLWSQDSAGIEGVGEQPDNVGAAVTTGDFNGDGYADLALGAPGEAVGSTGEAGAVDTIYGSAAGLASTGDQIWYQGSFGVQGTPGEDDYFGHAVAAGDFDGDGFDDLAVGVPEDDVILGDAGGVNVLYGSTTGLTGTGDQFWHQNVAGVSGATEALEWFGAAVASCDFDDDGYADLAIGVPRDSAASTGAGSVNILYGSSTGLATPGQQLFSQETPGVPGTGNYEDLFGYALTCGDFDGDGYADLAVGAPYHNVGSDIYAGSVTVLYGNSTGLISGGSQSWNATSTGSSGTADDQYFGYALATGDYDGDGYADLSIGAWGLVVSGQSNAGGVSVLYGTSSGLASTGSQLWHQDVSSVQGTAESGDDFGIALR